jgi:hypothetical protein
MDDWIIAGQNQIDNSTSLVKWCYYALFTINIILLIYSIAVGSAVPSLRDHMAEQ